jgi:hypothetical protein
VKDVGALKVAVGDSTAGLTRDVSALVTTVGGSTSGLVQSVNSLNTTVSQQRIYRQNTQPTTADRKIGDLWYDTSNGNAPYYWNGTSWIVNTDTTRASSADLTTEQSVRSTADSSLASYIMTASAGTSRVYTSDPGTSGRQNGDTWFRTDQNFRPYVWYNSQWNDNSSGAFTQYVGQIASVTQTASAAQSTANGLSYEWRVQGTIDGQPAGSLKLVGAKKTNTDGTTSTITNLVIDSNVSIKGDLIVDGTIKKGKLGIDYVSDVSANVGTLTAGVLKSQDNRFVIDLTNRTITISD